MKYMHKPTRRNVLLLLGLIILLAAGFFGWFLSYPPAYLPHQRIIIRLPYDPEDVPTGVMPMGETIYHSKPQNPSGHPGIDFGWEDGERHAILSASSGKVRSITIGASDPGKYDVEVSNGVYLLRYRELEDATPGMSVGQKVEPGELIGHAGFYCDNTGPDGTQHCWSNIHWELASRSVILDRWCPLPYFDQASRQSLEELWQKIPATNKVKSQFPDICSGDYAGKWEK